MKHIKTYNKVNEGKTWEDPKPENIADEFVYEFGSPRDWKEEGLSLKDWMLDDWGPNTGIRTKKGFDDCYEEVKDILSNMGYVTESVNEANMNSEILDVVEDLQTLIKKLKKDSNYKKRPEVEKLFTYAGPIVKELHKLVEGKLNEGLLTERNLHSDIANFRQSFSILSYDNPLLYAMIHKKFNVMKIEKFAQEIVSWIDKNYDQKTNGEVWKLATKMGLKKAVEKDMETKKANMRTEGKLNEGQGKLSTKDLKIIQALIKDPNAKLSYQEKSILKKLIGESIDEGTYIDLRIVNENVTDEIEQALSHWLNTLAEGDSVKMSDLYLDDGVLLGTLSPEILQGRLQIQEYFEMFLGKNPIGSIDSFILQNFGDICIADGTYTFELDGEEGGRTSVAARYTYVWKKENKKWMIATHHSSVNPK